MKIIVTTNYKAKPCQHADSHVFVLGSSDRNRRALQFIYLAESFSILKQYMNKITLSSLMLQSGDREFFILHVLPRYK